jgi:hypothetical protein
VTALDTRCRLLDMWNFIYNIPREGLDTWFRWLTILAIGLPVLGALLGAACGLGGFFVSNRIGELQTADLRQAGQTISRQNTEIETLKPWRLSSEQQKTLLEEIRAFPAGTIAFAYRVMDGEGKDFAEQLAEIFKSAGWSIGGIGGSSLNDLPGKVTVAIDAASSTAEFLKSADRVCDAFTRAGIPCGGDLKPNTLGGPVEPGIILVVIGRKVRAPQGVKE